MGYMTPGEVRMCLESLRDTIRRAPAPEYMQVALKHLREECPNIVSAFALLPDSAIIVLQKGKEPSVLVDDDGKIMCFR